MAAGLLAYRDLCGDELRQATLVEFRGSNLSDAGSIPAISTMYDETFPYHWGKVSLLNSDIICAIFY